MKLNKFNCVIINLYFYNFSTSNFSYLPPTSKLIHEIIHFLSHYPWSKSVIWHKTKLHFVIMQYVSSEANNLNLVKQGAEFNLDLNEPRLELLLYWQCVLVLLDFWRVFFCPIVFVPSLKVSSRSEKYYKGKEKIKTF